VAAVAHNVSETSANHSGL